MGSTRSGIEGRVETAEEVFAGFFLPEFRADPYPFYARLHALGGVHWSPLGGWATVGHTETVVALRDPRLSSARNRDMLEAVLGGRAEPPPFARLLRDMMVFRDPPDHERLRGLVNKAFTPRAVEAVRHATQTTAADLLASVEPSGQGDLMADFASQLPVLVIGEMLGVPTKDRPLFRAWSSDLIAQIDVLAPPDALAQADASGGAFVDYLEDLLRARRVSPGSDLLSALVDAEEGGDRLNHDEVIATALILLIAGYETTTNLIGNGTLALLQHGDWWSTLVADPTRARLVAEEALRFDSPVQLILRVATEDMEIGDQTVRSGDQVVAMLGAANRDPARFAEPHRFDPERSDLHHLAFGHGPHFCLGAALARLEGEVAFATLAQRLPRLALTDEPLEWRTNFTMRGLAALPVRW